LYFLSLYIGFKKAEEKNIKIKNSNNQNISFTSELCDVSFCREIMLGSQEKALSKSDKVQVIQSKYLDSLNKTKFFSHILFASKSGKTHSIQYPVDIFQALSLIAISITTQLSLSAFQTQIFCQISVQTEDISSPFVEGIITNKISVVYFVLNSCIFASIEVFSSCFKTQTLSITEESIFHKVAISKAFV
jgi:hypothetical protein